MRNHRVWIALVAMLAWWSCAAGAEEQSPPDPGNNGPWYFSVGVGGYWPTSSDPLKNQSGQVSGMIGGGYRASKYLSFGVDAWGANQRIDTPATIVPPILGTADSRARISTGGVSVVARLGWPIDRFEPYVGAGGGLFYSSLYVKGSALGATTALEETDTNWGGVLLGGFNYQVWQNWAVGAEFRRVSVKANFGSVVPGGDVQVGGNSVMATLRWSPSGHN